MNGFVCNKKEQPLLSIVVPVFNTGDLIIDFIKSILAQTYSQWELIFVDDGSDEKTIDYINNEIYKDNRIRLIRRERMPKGSLTCRNIGMQNALGDYIIHFDADDIIAPFCFEQRVSYMENNPSLDFAVFKGLTFCVNSKNEFQVLNHRWGRKRFKDDVVSFLKNDYPFSVWNCIYRSSVFKEILWDEKVKIYTDFSYILPSLINNFSYNYCESSEDDYFYRINQKNAMTSSFVSKDKFDSTIYLFAKILNDLQKLDKSIYYKKAFKTYFMIQFERILNTNVERLIFDFKDFFVKFYGHDLRLFVLLKVFFLPFFPKKNKMLIRFLFAVLYRPELIKSWFFVRFSKLFKSK